MFLLPCFPVISVVSLIKPALLPKLAVTGMAVPLSDNWPFCCNHTHSSPCSGPGMDILGLIWAWGGRRDLEITCAGSQTVAFLPRTHFFSANPLFRISAINSEGCIDGPVCTKHNIMVPLMYVCIPLRGELSSSFVNRKGHQINSLVPWLGKSHCIILPKQWLEQIRIHNNCIFSGSSGGGPVWELSRWTQEE